MPLDTQKEFEDNKRGNQNPYIKEEQTTQARCYHVLGNAFFTSLFMTVIKTIKKTGQNEEVNVFNILMNAR
jgi:hypothetical protein